MSIGKEDCLCVWVTQLYLRSPFTFANVVRVVQAGYSLYFIFMSFCVVIWCALSVLHGDLRDLVTSLNDDNRFTARWLSPDLAPECTTANARALYKFRFWNGGKYLALDVQHTAPIHLMWLFRKLPWGGCILVRIVHIWRLPECISRTFKNFIVRTGGQLSRSSIPFLPGSQCCISLWVLSKDAEPGSSG